MKVCPTCQSVFSGGEVFCPNDGSPLEDQTARGALAGATLGSLVKLERLEHSDEMGERYSGRLIEGKRPCYVTVFNASFSPSQVAPKLVETARAKIASPVPRQLTTLLQVEFSHYPPFVIETAPRGPSLHSLLLERRQLDWRTAAKLTANVARLIEWLSDKGVTHHGLHPASIFVTDLLNGRVQLGEWYSEDAQWVDNPMQTLAGSAGKFVGYVAYMGPELAMKGRAGDLRSAVYALGILLYELIVGRPPFSDPNPAEVLRRHITEHPMRLSIARGGGEAPADMDVVVQMMLEKDPAKRFQAPSAIIGALANLLGVEAETLAPRIERAEVQEEDDHYRTIEMSSVDRDSLPGLAGLGAADDADLSSTALLRKVETVRSAVALAGDRKTDENEREVDSPVGKTMILGSQGSTLRNTPAVDEDSVQKTLMLGSIGAAIEEAGWRQAKGKDDVEASPTDIGDSGTLKMIVPDFDAAVETPATSGEVLAEVEQVLKAAGKSSAKPVEPKVVVEAEPKVVVEPEPVVEAEAKVVVEPEPAVVEPVVEPEPVIEPAAVVVEPVIVDEPIPAEPTKTEPTKTEPSKAEPTAILKPAKSKAKEANVKPSKGKRDKRSSVEVDVSLLNEAHEKEGREFAEGAKAEKAEKAASAKADAEKAPTFEVGFIDTGKKAAETSDEWFAGDTPDWDAQLDAEHLHAAEQSNKRTLFIALGVVVAGAIAFVAYTQLATFDANPEFTKVEEVVVSEKPAFDLPKHLQDYDAAVAGGRLISPFGNCALSTLETVKREAPASVEYEIMRKSFVERTSSGATIADEAGDLNLARTLAGYASQWAPDDQALKKRAEEFQARYVGTVVVPGLSDVGAGIPDGSTEDIGLAAVPIEDPIEAPEPVDPSLQKVEKVEKTEVKVEKTTPQEPTPETDDKKGMLADARAAYSRGDLARAQKLYQELVKVDGGNHIVQAGLGQAFFDQAQYDDAVRHQLQAVKLRPGRTEYRINLGQSYYRLSRYKEAIAAWEEVLKIEPANANAKQYIELATRKLN